MKPINKNIIIIILYIIFLLQFFLIAHRLSFDTNLLFNFYKKDYGIIESLKISNQFTPAIEIKKILKNKNIKNFNISKKIKNQVSYTRIVELIYPIRVDSNSKYYFAFKEEFVKKCILIENLNRINLYECGK